MSSNLHDKPVFHGDKTVAIRFNLSDIERLESVVRDIGSGATVTGFIRETIRLRLDEIEKEWYNSSIQEHG